MSTALPVLFLRHESGATHALRGPRLAKLRREILAGRGGAEVTALVMSGYEGFLGSDGHDWDFSSLDAYFENPHARQDLGGRRAGGGAAELGAARRKITFEPVSRRDDTWTILLDGQDIGVMEASRSWNGEREAIDGYQVVLSAPPDAPEDADDDIDETFDVDARQGARAARAAAVKWVREMVPRIYRSHGTVR